MINANTNKYGTKPQWMGNGEEAGVKRNLFTAIIQGECRAHDFHTTPEGNSLITIDSFHYPVLLSGKT